MDIIRERVYKKPKFNNKFLKKSIMNYGRLLNKNDKKRLNT